MQKRLLFLTLSFVFLISPGLIKAQTVQVLNGDFENWSQNYYEVPDVKVKTLTSDFNSSNGESFSKANVYTMSKNTNGTGFAMRLESKSYPVNGWLDTTVGYAIWGGDPSGGGGGNFVFPGGFAFSDQNVTGLSADLKYSISATSPGTILIQFKKNGVPIDGGNAPFNIPGVYAFQISGTQSSFSTMTFSLPSALSVQPDTAVIAFTSNNPFNSGNSSSGIPGDYMVVDNISFTGTTQTVPGGNLDNWIASPYIYSLLDWTFDNNNGTTNYQTTDAYSGKYAVALSVANNGGPNNDVDRARLGNVIYNQSGPNTYIPGMQLSGSPQSLLFYYKYSTPAVDTASVYVVLTKWDAVNKTRTQVGGQYVSLLPAANYTFTYATMNYWVTGVTPDSAYIEFAASKQWPNNVLGSLLKVDDVSFNYCGETLSITGSSSVCPNATGVSYTSIYTPMSTYTWAGPTGSTIASGQGTDTVTINFGSTAGNVSVTKTYVDGCPSTNTTFAVGNQATATVNAGPNTDVCSNSSAQLLGSISGAGGGTWTGGSGTFNPDANTLLAKYTPTASEILAGSLNLTLTSTGNGGCSAATDQVLLTFHSAPISNPGSYQTVCANNANATFTGSVTNATGGTWTSSGSGSFNNASSLTTTYTPSASDIASGMITLSLTTTGQDASCTAATTPVNLKFSPAPTADAGVDQSVCANNSSVTLAGKVTVATGGTWSGGTGSFNPNANTLNAVYTPSASEISAGMVKLILTTSGNGTCNAVKDTMKIAISPVPTVNAGTDQTVCEKSSTVTLAGSITNATGATWSGGAGTFSNTTSLTSTYTPTAGEISTGSVTLTLTTNGTGACATVTDNVIISYNVQPTVNAGSDQTICASTSSVTLAGSQSNALSVSWTGGSGTFSNASSLTPTYTPSASDISSGSVTLTLSASGGACGTQTDQMIITIDPVPTVNAGADQSVCSNNATATLAGSKTNATGASWSGGTGTFSNASSLNSTYTPTAAEITNGSVTLTLTTSGSGACSSVSDQIKITYTPAPAVNAGADQTVCSGTNISVSGSETVATGAKWTTTGSGSFTSSTSLATSYVPSAVDKSSGSVKLILATTGNGNCNAVKDTMMVTIQPMPAANAGTDISLCQGATAQLNGSIVDASGGTWTSSGTGSFDNASALNAIYTPSVADQSGTVTLTLTSSGNGVCSASTSSIVLSFTSGSSANAGPDQSLCSGSTANLSGSVSGASGGQWSSSGTGTFSPDANTLNATYAPSAGDLSNGSVTLTLTTTGTGSCSAASDDMIITYSASSITANAGADQTVCSGSTASLNGSVSGATGGQWTTSGTGSFSPDANTLNATYIPSSDDMLAGTVTLTLTSTGNGSCTAGTDDVIITINTCTGVFASNAAGKLKVYPSPSTSLVTIEASTGTQISTVTVLNSIQEKVSASVISISGNKADVDLSGLNAGMYFIRIFDGSNVITQKVIKE